MEGIKKTNTLLRFLLYFCVLCFFLIFIYGFYHIKYVNTLAIALNSVPDEKRIEVLNSIKAGKAAVNSALLKSLGYADHDILFYIIILIFMSVFLGIFLLEKRVSKKNMQNERAILAAYLDSLENGTASLVFSGTETGLLYDRLYKLYTELRTTQEYAVKEKVLFQKNLEDIAHQIKTPVTAMLLSCENNLHISKDAVDNDVGTDLIKNLYRLDELTNRLLHCASLEAGLQPMKMTCFSPFEACLEAYEACEQLFTARSISVCIEPSSLLIYADYYWITEAFMNMYKNAAAYLSEGNTLHVFCTETPLYTEVVFKDDGKGISKEILRSIFNRFYKTPDSQGFGLGLHIAKSIAEKNNGRLSVCNNNGAVFTFTFYKDKESPLWKLNI